MTRDVEANSPTDPDDLIAYLDGEVDAEVRQQIESRLAQEPDLMQRMREHQQAWDFLDELPQEKVAGDFAQTTMEMVAVAVSRDVDEQARSTKLRTNVLRFAAVASLIAVSVTGFSLASRRLRQSDHELLRDLPVIENLEALQQVEDVDFLFALENEGLFVEEDDDAL